MSALTNTDLAKLAAGLAATNAALAAVQADVKVDDAALTAAQGTATTATAQAAAATALANQKQADLTAALAEQGRLRALLVANNIDPAGGTPAATIGPAVYDPATFILKVPFAGVVATKISRTGTDSGGHGPYDTSQSPASFLAAANAAHAIGFSGMNVPGQTVVVSLEGSKGEKLALSWTAPVTPPVTPPPVGAAKVRLGVYHFGYGSIDGSFDRALGKPGAVKVGHIYWNMNDGSFNGDFLGAGGYGAWLAGDKANRQALVGMSPLVDEPGNFGSARVRQQIRDFAAYVKAKATQYGFDAKQVLWRFGYEANGDWMPWGTQYGSKTAFKAMANDCKAIFRLLMGPDCIWVACVTPWNNGAPSFDFVLPDGTDWEGTADTYDDYDGGLGQGPIDTHVKRGTDLAVELNRRDVEWSGYDEVGVCSVNNGAQGAGDNPGFITATFGAVKAKGGKNARYVYFDVNVQETSTTLPENPKSLAALAALV